MSEETGISSTAHTEDAVDPTAFHEPSGGYNDTFSLDDEPEHFEPEPQPPTLQNEAVPQAEQRPISGAIYLWAVMPVPGLIAGIWTRKRNRQVSNRLFVAAGVSLVVWWIAMAMLAASINNSTSAFLDELGADTTSTQEDIGTTETTVPAETAQVPEGIAYDPYYTAPEPGRSDLIEGFDSTLAVKNLSFTASRIELPAFTPSKLLFINADKDIPHGFAIHAGGYNGTQLFMGEIRTGTAAIVYEIPELSMGEYFFKCPVHPGLRGTLLVN